MQGTREKVQSSRVGNVTGLDEKLSDELTSLHVNTKAHSGSVLETVFYTEESYSILPLLIRTFSIYPHDEDLIKQLN